MLAAKHRRRIIYLIMLGLGSLLFYYGMVKAVSPQNTLASLSHVFGAAASPSLIRMLVVAEITMAALLVSGVFPRSILLTSAVLFLTFTVWIGYLLIIGAPVTCGCGGEAADVSAKPKLWMLGRAMLLFGISVGGWVVTSVRTASDAILSLERSIR